MISSFMVYLPELNSAKIQNVQVIMFITKDIYYLESIQTIIE